MKKIIVLLTLAATAVGLMAQDTPPTDPPADRPMPNGLGIGLFNKRIDVNQLPEDNPETIDVDEGTLRRHVIDFRTRRENFLAERRRLFSELKDLTAEERRARIEELRTQTREELGAQRDLARQIREELRHLREERRNSSGG